jgi:prolyl-tRNA editing enzyme YbaK/EbsC (Cys-tRNA(Pro) deacylase)
LLGTPSGDCWTAEHPASALAFRADVGRQVVAGKEGIPQGMQRSVEEFLGLAGISHRTRPHSRNVYTCEEAASERGVRLSQVVKCLVGRDPNGDLHIMLIPGDKRLKLKRARQAAGGIRIELVPSDELTRDLDMLVGAISPTQFAGRARIYIDRSIFHEEFVTISSGQPDAGVEIKTEDLAEALGAMRCDIISASGS